VGTPAERDGKTWTFLTNHARVLIHIARNPQARIRDIAAAVGITERATQVILNDLEEADYLTRTRVGRRNTYTINPDRPFRHPAEQDQQINALTSLFTRHDEARYAPVGDERASLRGPAAEQAPPNEH